VWLSEVMLQQTTVKAVAPYFQRFVSRWPDVRALAAADEHEIMAAWAGLGYYSRARNLVACARQVAARPRAGFPGSAQELSQLPGIGPYTSAAIAAIAFDERTAVVDANAERVIARVFAIETPLAQAKEVIRQRLEPLVPAEHAGAFAEALMDLGATLCTPKKPACGLCPWSEPCRARQKGSQLMLPVKAAKKPRPTRYGKAFVARRSDGAILLRRRPPRGLLGGMSEVPGTEWAETAQPVGAYPVTGEWRTISSSVEHTFTHFHLRLSVERADVEADVAAPLGHWWAPANGLSGEALSSVMKKAIEAAYPGATQPSQR
jgi:A/G-specific adenine glycosylase